MLQHLVDFPPLNLTTHTVLGFALGLALFHNFQLAIIMAIGALIPDLDREYLFIAKNKIGQYQLHRALFHNFFFIAFLFFIVNPYLGLGALSHSLLDMSTTATDRGAEVLFPLTRIYKGFLFSIDGDAPSQNQKTKWWVEDPWGLLEKTSDRDLQEPGHQPWRRMYGPFKNSRIVDWGIFFSAIIFSLLSLGLGGVRTYSVWSLNPWTPVSALGIGIFYILGEWWRKRPVEKQTVTSSRRLVLGVLIAGLAIFILGLHFLFHPFIPPSYILMMISYALPSSIVGLVAGFILVKARQKSEEITV
jgi:hypothetical protein